MFSKEETHKEFISKTYKQLLLLNIKNTYKPRKKKKWAKDRNGYFSEESLQIAYGHMKRCLASLMTRKNANQKSIEVSTHIHQIGHF